MDDEQQRLREQARRIPILFSLVRQKQESKLERLRTAMETSARHQVERGQNQLQSVDQQLTVSVQAFLMRKHHKVELLEQKLKSLDPQLILQRGYSITLHNGKAVKDASTLQAGDEIETRLRNGKIKSKVTNG